MEEGARPAIELVGERQAASNLSRNDRGVSGVAGNLIEGESEPELYGECDERVLTVKVGLY